MVSDECNRPSEVDYLTQQITDVWSTQYVSIATLSGSIIARNRVLATRLLLPPTFLIFSANYFLPKTTASLSAYLGSLEETFLLGTEA